MQQEVKEGVKLSEQVSTSLLWSDETKIEVFGLSAKMCGEKQTEYTIHTVKHNGGSIMLCRVASL